MKVVVTVVGADKAGIIAAVTTTLAKHEANVLSINQTILDGIFNMIMIVELPSKDGALENVQNALEATALAQNVQIKAQHMDIFASMHSID